MVSLNFSWQISGLFFNYRLFQAAYLCVGMSILYVAKYKNKG